ncbi:2-amino-4-hydroxy-6-hydroxymethyldihydropteridine diphosphokinase [Corynebacterium testudinoris]|uniref:2-amino-4-hydroxy-6-hydroxymethyldihydropteridine diphosphokinase n=1 Tax=Corynebacterium testudinoris TaxID=136857 RepID=A0A0G3HCT0_9CORY|nr:2-amino-4-hydroxy-6-hydroxymethyldihydropteridine diphosphokinase [Corynebacterium testudinoris]AKK09743.1 2-amino-4-hydroxy-6-hydroxymethyldihydropteridine diphosphokinase [Corynebacterium testudinoris]MBX8996251.1 2-amino-4-hydroxy-6-hydroxymethyldihydropteridine diphosphokinase [Corynebacterium testudinoris]
MRAVLSIGSNLEDRRALLGTVVDDFRADIVAASPVFSTPPWGVEDQGEFLNAVVLIDVPGTPRQLLRRGQALEDAAVRRRVRHWGPRTLDVDIVQVMEEGKEVLSDDPVLTLPHPFAHERAFVLVPWLAADPSATLRGRPVAEWVAELDPVEVSAIKEVGSLL